MTDAEARELLHLVAKQDDQAFRRLYVGLMPSVRHMAWSVLNNEDDAREAANSTFLAVWQQAGDYEARGGATVKTWIIGIARFQALMLCRKRKTTQGTDSIEDYCELRAGDHLVPGGEGWLNADALTRCANALTSIHRQILALRSVEGLTNSEVGEVVGKPEGTIKRLHHEACNLMRRCLQKGGFGDQVPA